MPKFDSDRPFPKFDELVAEIERGRQAIALLDALWLELGPYACFDKCEQIPQELWFKINDFFDFDDSE